MNILLTLLIISACLLQTRTAPTPDIFKFGMKKEPTAGTSNDWWGKARSDTVNFMEKTSASLPKFDAPAFVKSGKGVDWTFKVQPGPLEVSCNVFYNREDMRLESGPRAKPQCDEFMSSYGRSH